MLAITAAGTCLTTWGVFHKTRSERSATRETGLVSLHVAGMERETALETAQRHGFNDLQTALIGSIIDQLKIQQDETKELRRQRDEAEEDRTELRRTVTTLEREVSDLKAENVTCKAEVAALHTQIKREREQSAAESADLQAQLNAERERGDLQALEVARLGGCLDGLGYDREGRQKPAPLPLSAEGLVEMTRRTGAGDHEKPLAGLQILVVEDDPDSLFVYRKALELEGAEAYTADRASVGLEMYEGMLFAALVSDIGLPGQDGCAMLRRIRQSEARTGRERLPAVAVTAYGRDEDRARALDAGFDTYLTKPVDYTELVASIMRLVGREPGSDVT